MIYEPLFFFDTAKAGDVKPWLGTSYAWSNGGKTLTVQLRHGVKWTDGKPFTSADVVFTFDQALHAVALNKFGLPLASVRPDGTYGVTINFTKSAYTDAYYALGRVEILPQHIWTSIKDPATFLNAHPVGTGAYKLSKVSPQVFELTANPHYYMPGLPKFKTIRFLAYSGNTTLDAAIEAGQLDWAGGYIPNIKKIYLAKNPKFVVSDIPLATTFLVPNMASGPTTNLAVRQAISAALNRSYISNTVYNGYAPATNPEALITPNYNSVLDPSLAGDKFPAASAATAKEHPGQGGHQDPAQPHRQDGRRLHRLPQRSADHAAGAQAGRDQPVHRPGGVHRVHLRPGHRQLPAADGQLRLHAGPVVVLLLDPGQPGHPPDRRGGHRRQLRPVQEPPGGHPAGADRRDHQPGGAEARLLPDRADLRRSTCRCIPLLESQDEIEFNGNVVGNIPTVSNPYGAPAVYIQPDIGWVAARLTPAQK